MRNYRKSIAKIQGGGNLGNTKIWKKPEKIEIANIK
jgi:hypothetical protein